MFLGDNGEIVTINSNRKRQGSNPTKAGEYDVLLIDPDNNAITRRIELADVMGNKERSMLRFLHCKRQTLFMVDLGLNKIYNLSLRDNSSVRVFGTPGKADGQFADPAGLVSDSFGNFIVADAGNNRLQVIIYFLFDLQKFLQNDY